MRGVLTDKDMYSRYSILELYAEVSSPAKN